jgi:glycosyltransferase involved in cell wall biosynthesis
VVGAIAGQLRGPYDVVVLFRARLAPLLVAVGTSALDGPPAAGRPHLVLDLDDDEVTAHRRLAALARRAGRHETAAGEEAAAAAYGRFLAGWAQHVDELWSAAPLADEIPGSEVRVVPNAVELPPLPPLRPPPEAPVPALASSARRDRLLFVGNLTYAPNIDAAELLARHVLPGVVERTGRRVHLDLVGQPSSAVRSLGRLDGVHVHGQVDDLEAAYRGGPLVVVPLRAGSGTRLKVLEAFARGCEVVATPLAVEGLGVTGREVVLGDDDPDAFTDCVAGALARPPDQARLAAARRYVATHHDRDAVVLAVAAHLRRHDRP